MPNHVFRKRVNRGNENPLENQVVTKEFLKATFLLVLVQIVTVWPYVTCSIAIPIYYLTARRSPEEWVYLEIARALFGLLFITKFVVDPIILVWRIPKYNRSLKAVYASCLKHCGCVVDEKEGRVAYGETRREDFDEDSQENINVEVI